MVFAIFDLPAGEVYTPEQRICTGRANVLLKLILMVSVYTSEAIAIPMLVVLRKLVLCYRLRAHLRPYAVRIHCFDP